MHCAATLHALLDLANASRTPTTPISLAIIPWVSVGVVSGSRVATWRVQNSRTDRFPSQKTEGFSTTCESGRPGWARGSGQRHRAQDCGSGSRAARGATIGVADSPRGRSIVCCSGQYSKAQGPESSEPKERQMKKTAIFVSVAFSLLLLAPTAESGMICACGRQ